MRINDYSSIELSKATLLPQPERITPKFIEKILLILIAILGIMGSLYVFSNSANSNNNTPNYHNLSMAAVASLNLDEEEIEGSAKFKDFFKIEGKKKAGELLTFKFKQNRSESRYVLDMGNGERVIITSDEFPYKFDKPGKYTMELKTVSRGLISIIATKELKIK